MEKEIKVIENETMKKRIDEFAEIKQQLDILTKMVENEKTALLAELGVGAFATDKNILYFNPQKREKVEWKEICENNIAPEILKEEITNNTHETKFVVCKIKQK